MFNPVWLASFKAVAEWGGFTRAAEKLGLTQAGVSQHVRQLENQLGLLFIRRPREVELTPAGATLLNYCSELDQLDRRLAARLSSADETTGEISLISPGSVGLALYRLLLDLQQLESGLVIRHRFAPDHEVLRAVLDKQYELGLVTLRPDDHRLTATAFTEEPLELVLPIGERVETWDDLQRLGFIDHPDGRAMATRLLARLFPGNPGVGVLPVRGFSNQIGLILEPVARGLGFTVIPRHARQAFAGGHAIRSLKVEPDVVDTLWLIHRAEWPLSRPAAYAINYLSEHMQLQP